MEWLSPIKPLFNTPINRSHPLAQGLVSMWNFSEGMGDLVHDSVGMNDGKCIGMAPFSGTSGWVPGPHGAALAFDGSNDYGVLPASMNRFGLNGTGSWTILAWEKTSTTSLAVLAKGYATAGVGNIGLYSDRAYVRTATLQIQPSSSVPLDGLSHCIGGIWNVVSGKVSFWCDGISKAEADWDGTIISDSGVVQIGALYKTTGSARFFNGLISSVSIYNRALTAEEIAYLYAFPWCMYDSSSQNIWRIVIPSPGYTSYTKGDYAELPTTDNDLKTEYVADDLNKVAFIDQIRVGQLATERYMVHQYKTYAGPLVGHNECTVHWVGQTDLSPVTSSVCMQIYNQVSSTWETLYTYSENNVSTDFAMDAVMYDLTNYKDEQYIVSFRIYQQAV